MASALAAPDIEQTATISRSRRGRILAGVLAALVVLYGAILRLDAITLKYGPVTRPGWLRSVQLSRVPQSVLRPSRVTWDPVPTHPHRDGPPTHYISDPYTYLHYAREMRGFYAAHRREPVFPFVTKVFLQVLDQQDVAVSFASASFSVLAIIATYLLGAYAFSSVVGLGAALALAIEYDVISWGVDGWRDDAFTCAVVLSTYAMLRYSRQPSRWHALFVGTVAGLACLIRVTSLSFLVPGFGYLLLTTKQPWRARLRGVGLGVLTATVIAAPFAINCWRVFGDPLYAINVHADVYRATQGEVLGSSQTARQYVESEIRRHPIQTMDTIVLGMTSYPFLNKWSGFDVWLPSLGKWLSWAAILGVLLFLDSGPGRFVLLVLITSLIPYAVTWRLIADWRFTEHAYPFLLLAACYAIAQVVSLASRTKLATLTRRAPDRRRLALRGVVLTGVGVGVWMVLWALPLLAVQESLRSNEPVSIMAGGRDAPFFVQGWSVPRVDGNLTTRIAMGPRSVVRIPLPRVQEYELTLRLDPFPRPSSDHPIGLPTVRVSVNDHPVAILTLQWNRDRVGAYRICIPSNVARRGFNRLAFATEAGSAGGFRLWYVRIHPAPTTY